MEQDPLIPLSFHLPIPLRHPSFGDIYPNILSRSSSNRNPSAAKPSPLASVELCKRPGQTGLIPACSNPQAQGKLHALCQPLPDLAGPGSSGSRRSPTRVGPFRIALRPGLAANKQICKQLCLPQRGAGRRQLGHSPSARHCGDRG